MSNWWPDRSDHNPNSNSKSNTYARRYPVSDAITCTFTHTKSKPHADTIEYWGVSRPYSSKVARNDRG